MKKKAKTIVRAAIHDLDHVLRDGGELTRLFSRVPLTVLTSHEASHIDGILQHVREELAELLEPAT